MSDPITDKIIEALLIVGFLIFFKILQSKGVTINDPSDKYFSDKKRESA